MKNLFFIATMMLSVTVFAQSSKAEKWANGTANQMVEVLNLEESNYDALFEIHKAKNIKIFALDANLSKEELKSKKRAIYAEAQDQMKDLLGLETMKKWWAFQKENRNK